MSFSVLKNHIVCVCVHMLIQMFFELYLNLVAGTVNPQILQYREEEKKKQTMKYHHCSIYPNKERIDASQIDVSSKNNIIEHNLVSLLFELVA